MSSNSDTGCAKIVGTLTGLATIVGVIIAFFAWIMPFHPTGSSPIARQQPTTQPAEVTQAEPKTLVVVVTPTTIPQPTTLPPTAQRLVSAESLQGCSSLAKRETRTISRGTFIVGDVVVNGTPQYDPREKEGTVVFLERDASIFAEWGAACYQGNIGLLSQVIQGEYNTGCDTGCIKVRAVIVRSDGQQEVKCYYPGGVVKDLQKSATETWCP
jgi:hypothetical protein